MPPEFLMDCIAIAKQDSTGSSTSGSSTAVDELDSTGTKDFIGIVHSPSLGSESYSSDFYGFPSNPVSIYHTGDPWPRPTGPDAQRLPKEARPVCNHPIAAVWHELGRRVYQFFDSVGIKWTSIDPIRFAEVRKEAGPLYLWVGVMPGTLSSDDAKDAAVHVKKILEDSQIPNVEIAFRESIFTRSAGSPLLNYVSSVNPTAKIRSPFTPALGVHIAPRDTPHFEGTGGLYLREGGESDRVFLLTARHVVFPPTDNKLYARKNKRSPCREVILLGTGSYQKALRSAMSQIGRQAILIDNFKDELKGLGEAVEGEDDEQAETRKKFQGLLNEAENTLDATNKFHTEITKHWSTEHQRVLGHIVHSPPISVGTGRKPFTEDWALIELCREKIDWKTFKGNVIDLGMKSSPDDFTLKMYPHPTARASFKYPRGRLLQLRGIVQEDELRHPTMLDGNGEECLHVVKSGKATGVTIGRATGIESFVRDYDGYDICSTSMELAIYPYSHDDGVFSARGDSGSIIADGKGRVVGLLTGGSGQADSTDVTYASPYYWIHGRIKDAFPSAHLYPIVA